MDAREAAERVRAVAKAGDPDRYAAALFLPAPTRDRLLPLIAFNVELANIAPQVREPQLGEIRLEWWREAVGRALAGEATGQPVADAIGHTAHVSGLSQADLNGLIDARHFDVAVKLMPDEAALERYLDETAGSMFRLGAAIATTNAPASARDPVGAAAKVAGRAFGLTGLMRALPVHLRGGRLDIPGTELGDFGLSPAALLAGEGGEGLSRLLAGWRERAEVVLGEAMREARALPPEARRAFLPLALVAPYLKALAEEREPLLHVAGINPLYRLWRLATSKLR